MPEFPVPGLGPLFVALAKIPWGAIGNIAAVVEHVATSPDPVDAARRMAEEAARQRAFDEAMARVKP